MDIAKFVKDNEVVAQQLIHDLPNSSIRQCTVKVVGQVVGSCELNTIACINGLDAKCYRQVGLSYTGGA